MNPTKEQKLIYKMLTENTGIHFLDSGFSNGRMWQRNQKKTIKDFMNEDEETYTFDGKYLYLERSVSVFHYLSQLELDEVCDKFNRRNNNPKDWEGDLPSINNSPIYGVGSRAADWLSENYEVDVKYTINTYNQDSDLSQILQYSKLEIFVDGQNETYYLIQIHGGADARGGYTDAKLFKQNRWSYDIHEYLQEYRDSYDINQDLQEGYITDVPDSYDKDKTWTHEQILELI